ncbi:MAG: LysR family transcriptional regulator [Pseudomonadota bacterium]
MEHYGGTFDWSRVRAFLATAEEGSFTAAARVLGLSQPTLSRQVEALERDLNVVLFERVGRGLELTPTGHALLASARAMGDAAGTLALTASGHNQTLSGRVSITASDIIVTHVLPGLVMELQQRFPDVSLELIASNETMDLQRREADIAIRNYRPTQDDLIAVKLGDADAGFYAAPNFLARFPPLRSKQDLSTASLLGFDNDGTMMGELRAAGLPVDDSNFQIICASHSAQWELAKRGAGIVIVPTALGDKEPSVVRVLADEQTFSFPIWLTCHRELRTTRRIRAVFELLAKRYMFAHHAPH